jgi:hypothetical protein
MSHFAQSNTSLRFQWVPLHCAHCCWHDQLRNHTSQTNSRLQWMLRVSSRSALRTPYPARWPIAKQFYHPNKNRHFCDRHTPRQKSTKAQGTSDTHRQYKYRHEPYLIL